MSDEDKKERKFQFALTKAQVDFEFWFAFSIGMFAVAYAMLAYFKDNFWATVATDGLLALAALFLIRVYNLKEKRFKQIRETYIEK